MIRAIIDGKVVVGWYFTIHDRHFISSSASEAQSYYAHNDTEMFDILAWYEIPDISLCAVATGRMDKNDVEIFGSKGDMQGGDRVSCVGDSSRITQWSDEDLQWQLGGATDGTPFTTLSPWDADELEIIPRED